MSMSSNQRGSAPATGLTLSRRRLIVGGAVAAIAGPQLFSSHVGGRPALAARGPVPELVEVDGAAAAELFSMSADGRRMLVATDRNDRRTSMAVVDVAGGSQRLPAPPGGDSPIFWFWTRLNSTGTFAYRVDTDETAAPEQGRITLIELATSQIRVIDFDLSTPGESFRRRLHDVIDVSVDASIIAVSADQSGFGRYSFLTNGDGVAIDPGVTGIQIDDDDGIARLATMSADGDRITYTAGSDGDISSEWVEWIRSTDVRTRFPTPTGRSARQTADRSLSTFVGLLYPTGVEVYDRTGRGSTPSFPGSLRSVVATTSAAVMEVFDRDRDVTGLVEAAPGDEAASWLVVGDDGKPIPLAGTWRSSDSGDVVALVTNDTRLDARIDEQWGSVVVWRRNDTTNLQAVAGPVPAEGLRPAVRLAISG